MLYLALVRMKQGEHGDAMKFNRMAYRAMRKSDEVLGQRYAEMDLGLIHLASGDPRSACTILSRVARDNLAVLDLNMAGSAYHNLGTAHAKLGEERAALDAYVRALRAHTATGRHRFLASTYQNLGLCLNRMRRPGAAFAALEKAMELAERTQDRDLELRVLTEVLKAASGRRDRSGCIPALLGRCERIVRGSVDQLSKEALGDFSRLGAQMIMKSGSRSKAAPRGRRQALASRDDHRELIRITGNLSTGEYEKLLSNRLGSGLSGRLAPSARSLKSFLLLFVGDAFRFHQYVTEFSLPTSPAKTQLRELCLREIVAIVGSRKGARYCLAFHRS